MMMMKSMMWGCFRWLVLLFILALLNKIAVASSVLLSRGLEAQTEAVPGWWSPKASDKLSWQIQLQGKIDTSFAVDVYSIDLFDAPQSVIDYLHAHGRIVVCYFTAGQYDYWHEDWAQFFNFTIAKQRYEGNQPPFGGNVSKWGGRWLDIKRIDLLSPIMTARIALAKTKGCDALDVDNLDGWSYDPSITNLTLNYTDQITYNRFIANTAHAHGLSIGLKNDLRQIKDLVNDFDWAQNESCLRFKECGYYQNFTNVNKAVFAIEYSGNLCKICRMARTLQFSLIKKKQLLKAWRRGCSDPRTVRRCFL